MFAAGCATTEYSAKDAGFQTASLESGDAMAEQGVWIQKQQAKAVGERVKALMARKTIDVETAVQVVQNP